MVDFVSSWKTIDYWKVNHWIIYFIQERREDANTRSDAIFFKRCNVKGFFKL